MDRYARAEEQTLLDSIRCKATLTCFRILSTYCKAKVLIWSVKVGSKPSLS